MSGHELPPEDQRTMKFYRNDEPLRCPTCNAPYTDVTLHGPMTEVHEEGTGRPMWMPAKVVLACGHELPLPPKEPVQ